MNLYWKDTANSRVLLTSDAFLGNEIVFDVELMTIPNITFTIPIEVLKDQEKLPDAAFEFVLEFDNGHIFHGKVMHSTYDLVNNIVTIEGDHVAEELEHQRIPTNYAVKEKTLEEIYETDETLQGKFNAEDWTFKFVDEAKDVRFSYLFSNQDKLTALTDACKQTENVFWRISLTEERTIEIGFFGQYVNEFLVNDFNMLGNSFQVEEDFRDLCNYGIYLTDKSDSGTSALTLRDVYNKEELINPDFPIIETGQEINTERRYDYIDLIPFGANNHGDYAVLDKEGVALEAGNIYEEAFTSNDVQTIANQNEELSDEDRLIASRQLYAQAIRKLIHRRRKIAYTFQVNDLPRGINVGDKLRLQFIDEILKVTNCTNYYKKLLQIDDYFYISNIKMTVGLAGHVVFTVTVEKFIYNNSEV